MKRIVIAVLSSTFLAVSPALTQGTSNMPPLPSAWIGVDIQRGKDDAGNTLKYPVISSVSPGSPANKAGLTVGDTVLKFNDIDASVDPFGIRRLLHPGRAVRLMLRHNGVRTVRVIPSKRPAMFDDVTVANIDITPLKDDDGSNVVLQVLTPIAAPPAMRTTMVVAGASLTRMNADLAAVLHIQNQGVFVISVAPATPAMRAGLKGGDVIVQADSIRVMMPVTIMQAMSIRATHDSSDHRVALNIVRLGKERMVVLRW